MSDIILKVLEMSFMGSVVILVTILMRLFLKKSSKKYVMILWAIVALRLLVPVSFESALSVFNYIPHKVTSIKEVSAPAPAVKAPEVKKADVKPVAKTEAPATIVNKAEPQPAKKVTAPVVPQKVEAAKSETSKVIDLKTVFGIVYGVGVVGIVGYCAISYVMLRRKIKDATEIEKNVYESEKVNSPFVLGFITPKIYLPDVLEKDEREYILLHERTHIRHGDWISKLIGMAVVAVHWFNPIVWIGYALFEQDIEMLCDEDTVATMDNELKRAYTMSIVTYAKKSSGKVYLVAPLSFSKPNFGKKEVTNRVKNIINYKKGTKITAILTTLVVFGVSTACAFNSTSDVKDEAKTTETTKATVAETTETTAADVAETEESKSAMEEFEALLEEVDFDSMTEEEIDEWFENNYPDIDSDELWYNEIGTPEVKTHYYELLMDKATELHKEDDDDSLLFGLFDVNMGVPDFWKLYVVDKATGEETPYGYDFDTDSIAVIESDEEFPCKPMYAALNNTAPEDWMMPYDDFVTVPGAIEYDLLPTAYQTEYNKDTYHSVLPDGAYEGTVYGLSEDLKVATINLAPMSEVLSEDISGLKAGDTFKYGGKDVVIDPEDFESSFGYTWVKDGSADHLLIRDFELKDNSEFTFAQVPLADDFKLTICDLANEKVISLDKDEVYDFFRNNNRNISDSGIFEGYGITFECGTHAFYLNHPIVIENGEIVELTMEFYFFSCSD